MGCLWCGKYTRQFQDDAIRTARIHHAFIPVTGLKCLHGKIFSPLTEIPGGKTTISWAEPACPLIWTHQIFYKGFRSKEISVNPAGSYREALSQASISFPDVYAVESLLRYTLPLKTVISQVKIFLFELLYKEARGHTVYTRLVITRKGLHLAPFWRWGFLNSKMTYILWLGQTKSTRWTEYTHNHKTSHSYVFRYAGEFRKQLTAGSEGWSKGNVITKVLSCNKFRSH